MFTIVYRHTYTSPGHATAEAAEEAFFKKWPDGVAGHEGDLSEGGDKTYCWVNEAVAEADERYVQWEAYIVEVKPFIAHPNCPRRSGRFA
jgi:hypothetical protein